MLVTAVAILVSDRITLEQLKLADKVLDNFCKLMPEPYGEYVNLIFPFQAHVLTFIPTIII